MYMSTKGAEENRVWVRGVKGLEDVGLVDLRIAHLNGFSTTTTTLNSGQGSPPSPHRKTKLLRKLKNVKLNFCF